MGGKLDAYRGKRHFERTPEPSGDGRPRRHARPQFVVQQHAARRLHYDFRLEHEGVLKSWAVPKGPSLDPAERRLAVQTEDHPLEYAEFEGVIPRPEYGGGTVLVWDRGTWTPSDDPSHGLERGKLDFELQGDKLRGRWTLVRLRHRPEDRSNVENWLLIKRRDREARTPDAPELVEARPESVLTGRDLAGVAADADRVWHSNGGGEVDPVSVPQVGRPETVEGARRDALPTSLAPQLATLVKAPPTGTGWFHEPKLDGYRLLARIDSGQVTLTTRRGNDWTERFPGIAEAARALPCRTAVLDGEAVAFDASGRSDFQRLQTTIGQRDADTVMVAFDLLYLDGWDLRGAALRARKELLRLLLAGARETIRYGEHIEGTGDAFFREACALGLEGIVSKRAAEPYRGKRTQSWLKIKCEQRQELVIAGFTDPGGSRTGFGALLLGVRAPGGDGSLRYAGKVGTGFDTSTLRTMRALLDQRIRRTPPVTNPPRGAEARGVHWVRPDLVAEIAFGEWTRDGVLRHPRFRGLREDKPVTEVVVEEPMPSPDQRPTRIAGVTLTHPDKVLFPDPGLTKRQLARYWEQVAPWALPHLRDRPLTLVRCPEGQHQQCFYQKRLGPGTPAEVARVPVRPGEAPYAMIEGLPSIIALVQLGVLELHVWGSRAHHLEQPDQIVFDLDPSEELGWRVVVEAAFDLRRRLDTLGLTAFARVTGGKGLHLVVPVDPGPRWSDVKRFSQEVAREMVRDHPDRFTALMTKSRRGGKIFIDYLRNAREATAIAAYSPRAKPGAPVALPISWDELDVGSTAPPRYSALDVPGLIERRARDPWESFDQARRRLI